MNIKYALGTVVIGVIILFSACTAPSFKDQIKGDIETRMATGICDSIPGGSNITNIQIGEIVDIGIDGMTDVSIEFDFEHNGIVKHHSSAMLYLKKGNTYHLAVLGGCKYEMK